jgi:hypothetical protein
MKVNAGRAFLSDGHAVRTRPALQNMGNLFNRIFVLEKSSNYYTITHFENALLHGVTFVIISLTGR